MPAQNRAWHNQNRFAPGRCGHQPIPVFPLAQDGQERVRVGLLPSRSNAKLDQRYEWPVDNHVPARRGTKLRDIEPGFFLELSPKAEIKIDFVNDDVIGIWRAAGKIDLPGLNVCGPIAASRNAPSALHIAAALKQSHTPAAGLPQSHQAAKLA